MADIELTWKVEKIEYCDGVVQESGFDSEPTDTNWVKINPYTGTGEANSSITVKPSNLHDACEDAVITISASTGDKRQVTINRCNPECNCDSIASFLPSQVSEINADGDTVKVADFSMNYGCDYKGIELVNTGSGCRYEVTETTVNAIVDANPSHTNSRTFSYYVTYNGKKCDKIQGGTFSQARSILPCETATTCPDLDVPGADSEIGSDGGQKQVTFDFHGNNDCWRVTNVTDKVYGSNGFNFEPVNATMGLLIFAANDTYEEKKYNLVFEFVNDVASSSCTKSASTITVKAKEFVPTCETCADANISENITPKLLRQQGYSTAVPIASFTASCNPGFSVSTAGGDDIIINNTQMVTKGTGTNEFYVLAAYNINNNAKDKTQNIKLMVGNEECKRFTITQPGTGETPTVDCKIDEPTVKIVPQCINNAQSLIISAKKNNSKCSTQTLVYEIVGTSATGEVSVRSTSISQVPSTISPSVEAGEYTVKWHNKYDDSNSGETSVDISSCTASEKAKVRVMITAGSNGYYINHIDNLFCYFKSKTTEDVKKITFSKDLWYGIDEGGGQSIPIPREQMIPENGYCQTGEDTFSVELENTGRYISIYQDFEIDLKEIMDSDDNITYDFCAVELVSNGGVCNVAGNSELQLKKYNGSTPEKPGVDWCANWGTADAPKSFLCINGNGNHDDYVKKVKHLCTCPMGDDCTYKTRIYFKIDNLDYDDFYQVDNPNEKGCNTFFLIYLWPNGA